jgi:hypothetical protein
LAVWAEVKTNERTKKLRVKICFMGRKFGLNLIVYVLYLPMLCQNAAQLVFIGF